MIHSALLVIVALSCVAQAVRPPTAHKHASHVANPGCTCVNKYHPRIITGAIRQATSVDSTSEYPKIFANREVKKKLPARYNDWNDLCACFCLQGHGLAFDSACKEPDARLYEYPLTKTHAYKSGPPFYERVIYVNVKDSKDRDVQKFCGCVQHERVSGRVKECREYVKGTGASRSSHSRPDSRKIVGSSSGARDGKGSSDSTRRRRPISSSDKTRQVSSSRE